MKITTLDDLPALYGSPRGVDTGFAKGVAHRAVDLAAALQ